jgi:L-ribulokinase
MLCGMASVDRQEEGTMSRKYVIGLDYGTESGRALLVAADSGEEVAIAVLNYADGVIDDKLPGTGEKLPPDWALQNPADYLTVCETVIPEVLRRSGVSGADVIGIGVDFTACTLIPIDAEGTPLCLQPAWSAQPHAWPKLWKHHGAQAQATRINDLAQRRKVDWLARYGGKVSSEWLFPKALQVLEEAPDVYLATDRFIEAGDWMVLVLTGEEKRNACAAGYKACWGEGGYPEKEFFRLLDPAFENIVAEKLSTEIYPAGVKAGGLTEAMAAKLGLHPGTAVSVGGIDAHVAVPATTVSGPGKMVMIMGTSLCHMVCGTEKRAIEGLCGVVKDGILPGLYGYEAGQAAVGDIFAWFIQQCVPKATHDAAAAAGVDIHTYLAKEAGALAVGESGLLCLDWWNGNRSILVDAELSGLMVGMTLATTPAEMYRALLECTAFGTYKIIRQLEDGGCPIDELYACGGLPGKNPLLMQIFADVTGREIKIAASDQTVALGAAMWGAVAAGAAAGGYDTIEAAAKKMARLRRETFRPNPANHKAYEALFAEYERLHDLFGRGGDTVMKTLKSMKRRAHN